MGAAWQMAAALLVALALGACSTASPYATATPPSPHAKPPTAREPKPKVIQATPPNPDHIPQDISGALDDTERTLACIDYNHITLLNETDKGDEIAVKRRLNELRAAKEVCQDLVDKAFADFEPFRIAYSTEWAFYQNYFGLTLEAFAVHNRPSFCRQYAQTIEVTQAALEANRVYARWLQTGTAQGSSDPILRKLRRMAADKVAAFKVVVDRLASQYTRECTTR